MRASWWTPLHQLCASSSSSSFRRGALGLLLLLLRLLFFLITPGTIFIIVIIIIVVIIRGVLGRDEVLVRRVLVVTVGGPALRHVLVAGGAVEAHGAFSSFVLGRGRLHQVPDLQALGREELEEPLVLVAVDRRERVLLAVAASRNLEVEVF